MRTAYYARPLSVYGTECESRDMVVIRQMGFEPVDVNKEELQAAYKERGMAVFRADVETADALIFRAFPDGSIGAGVRQEIAWADAIGLPVLELPRQVERRSLSVEQTREMLRELGQR